MTKSLLAGARRSSGLALRSSPRSDQAGLGLVEVLIAATLVALGMVGFVVAAISSQRAQSECRARIEALHVARATLEAMQGLPFEEVFATFNEDPEDDPAGVGTAIGREFDARDFVLRQTALLQPLLPANVDPLPCRARIEFPVDPVSRLQLREDLNTTDWPNLDLNADGVSDSLGHETDYVVLPVRIHVEWRTENGVRTIQLESLITRR